ncbi:hypothetical protein [Clostridium tarantellae]|uniref:Uncharacterized protein n=1 Tax=Clostridium tarantellae TaxID=39493 RepID=A0A6I1MLH2_9CLOT|nr:hypothetical protein [Clostridium tarantellae]MPQ42967.1 hypothetical protein [Clostridium tarantellae]
MKKEIRTTCLLNVINYINNLVLITYFSMYQNLNINNNIYVLKLGIVLSIWLLSPLLLLFVTTYPLLNNENLYYKNLKRELIIDVCFKIISYIVLLSYTKTIFLSDIYKLKVVVQIVLMFFSLIINFKIYKKVKYLECNSINIFEEDTVTEIEKRNIENIKKASYIGNTSFLSFIIFGLSLILFSTKEMNWQVDIIATVISSISFVKFINSIYKKSILIYSENNNRNKVFKKEIIYATISYSICIVVSMNLVRIENEIFRYITYLISILALYPIMKNNKNISIKYKKVKKSLVNELMAYYEK